MLKKYLHSEIRERWQHLVDKARQVAILGHISPDGDAMGSTLAMAHYLRGQGKKVRVVVPTSYPDFLSWLPGADDVWVFEYAKQAVVQYISGADLVFCMDFNSIQRLEQLAEVIRHHRAPVVTIDHHLSPDAGVALLISDPHASSTCEIVFSLLHQLGGMEAISKEMAECLYCGMMTDTGSFTYNSNRSELFYIISMLLSKGIDKDRIYRNVNNNYSEHRLRFVGYVLNEKLKFYKNHRASIFTITREEMKKYGYEMVWTPERKYITYILRGKDGTEKRVRDKSLFDEKYRKENMEHEFRIREELYGQAQGEKYSASDSGGNADGRRNTNGSDQRRGVGRADCFGEPPGGAVSRTDGAESGFCDGGGQICRADYESNTGAERGDSGGDTEDFRGSIRTGWESERKSLESYLQKKHTGRRTVVASHGVRGNSDDTDLALMGIRGLESLTDVLEDDDESEEEKREREGVNTGTALGVAAGVIAGMAIGWTQDEGEGIEEDEEAHEGFDISM